MAIQPLPETEAQAVLLARAFEEADVDRRLGLRAPVLAVGEPRPFLVTRASALVAQLDAQLPFLASFRRLTRLGAGLAPWTVALAVLLGLSSSALGPARRVNLLSLPLLGLIAWNLALYLAFALVWLLRGRFLPGHGLPRLLPGVLTLGYLRRLRSRLTGIIPAATATVVGGALGAFLGSWREVARPLTEARARRLFHLGAVALTAGLVAGMYLRGLVLEYRATWESTFLSPAAAESLLGAVLAPARQLLRLDPPPLATLRAPADGEAAIWIHLLATTAALFVALPRVSLVLIESVRIRRLARRLPIELESPYFRRLLSWGPREVVLQPYSFSPSEAAVERLREASRDLFGDHATVRILAPLAYGDEALPELDERAEVAVLLFNLAQTPEKEVQARVAKRAADRGPWRALIDASTYRRRLGGGAEATERLAERHRFWSRTLRDSGLPVFGIDLETAALDTLTVALGAAPEASR